MKICDIVQFYSPLSGGVRRYLEDKAHYLAQHTGHEHIVIVPSERNAVLRRDNSVFYEIKSLRLIGSISYRMLLNQKRIHEIIQQEQPDIIEVGDPYRSAWIALQAAERWNIPIVAFYHSDFPRALGRTIHRFLGHRIENLLSSGIHSYVLRLYNRMNATIVAGRRLEKVLTECGIKNVIRIPLGTNTDCFQPSPNSHAVREELNLKNEERLLLFVGRLAREKNIRALIDMMDLLTQNHSARQQYRLLLVGDGELNKMVQKALSTLPYITWYPFCNSTEQLAAFYTAADLFVHAGHYETFGITSLEAQACGTRVLAVRNGGLDDTVSGEEPSIMAESHTGIDLAKAVQEIFALQGGATPEQRRQRILENFTTDLTYTRIVSLYEHIVRGEPLNEFSTDLFLGNEDGIRNSAILTGRP